MTPERKRALRNERNFFIPILRMLQDNGGELEDISQIGRLIPSYSDITEDEVNYFEITKKGNRYVPYWFGRNFALKNLQIAGFLTYSRNEPLRLTPEGLSLNIETIDFDRDIYSKTADYWKKKSEERHERLAKRIETYDGYQASPVTDNNKNETIPETETEDFKTAILDRVKSLDPIKFEAFARGLLKKMGFDIDPNKGIKASGDGGIDGFAYCTDDQSLKSSRVAIQCKRYTTGSVGGKEIEDFKGPIDTFRADYGVFITTSYFSRDAIEKARNGSTTITLIDGERLVDLMIQYKYKVREVPTYVVDEQYFGE